MSDESKTIGEARIGDFTLRVLDKETELLAWRGIPIAYWMQDKWYSIRDRPEAMPDDDV